MTHYEMTVEATDRKVEYLLRSQVREEGIRDCGGILSEERNLVEPKFSIYSFKTLVSAYCCRDSRYFESSELLDAIKLLMAYIQGVQREDGSFDLVSVNFCSSPDTAFMAMRLVAAYRIIERYGGMEIAGVLDDLRDVLSAAGRAMRTGGFHTPNHRWVVAAALLMAYNIVGESSFKEAAEQYLAEGIDCDEIGEWTERSSGVYNVVCDNAFIIIAEELGEQKYLEPVRRNLEFMLYHMEPDGSIYTGNSTRQDVFQTVYPLSYYHLYLFMGWRDQDGRFMAMANKLMASYYAVSRDIGRRFLLPGSDFLYMFLLYPELKSFQLAESDLPTNYEKYYPKSGLVRVRRGELSYSVTQNNSRFLTVMVGDLHLDLEIRSAFFAIGQFNVSQEDRRWNRASTAYPIELTEDGYRLRFSAWATYFLPFDTPPTTPVYAEMDHSRRRTTTPVRHEITVNIRGTDAGVEVMVETAGCDHVPIQLIAHVSPHCLIEGEGFLLQGKPGDGISITSGLVQISRHGSKVEIGPGLGRAAYLPYMAAPSETEFTLYFSGYTNLKHTFSIRKLS